MVTEQLAEVRGEVALCDGCGHEWHGLPCMAGWGTPHDGLYTWPSYVGEPCGCPTSFQEVPC